MQRVMIIGGAGSGKSTLARKLGEITGLPVVHIDPMYWTSEWTQRPASETIELSRAAASAERWIFEGNHTATMPDRLMRADTLIFLDIGTVRRLWRIVLRTLRYYGRTRPDMAEGCPERFEWEFLKWVAGYHRKGRIQAMNIITALPARIRLVHLRSPREVTRFLCAVASDRGLRKPQEGISLR